MKKIILLALIILCLLFCIITNTSRDTDDAEEFPLFSLATYYPFGVFQYYDEEFLYLNEESLVYSLDPDDGYTSVFEDVEADLFAATEDFLLYTDSDGVLHIQNLFYDFDKKIDFSGTDLSSAIAYENGIVYISDTGTLNVLYFESWNVALLADTSVSEFIIEEGVIYYLESIEGESNSVYSLNTATGEKSLIVSGDITDFAIAENYVYYTEGSSLYKMGFSTNIKEAVSSGVSQFSVSDTYILIKDKSNSVIVLDPEYGKLLDESMTEYTIMDESGDLFICSMSQSDYLMFVSQDQIAQTKYGDEYTFIDAGFAGEYIYLLLESEDGYRAAIYDSDGNLLFTAK